MKTTQDLWQFLEAGADRMPAAAALYSWSLSCVDATPFRLYLDIIGYSNEQFGEPLVTDLRKACDVMGYKEIGLLAEALTEYSDKPHDVEKWLADLTAHDEW